MTSWMFVQSVKMKISCMMVVFAAAGVSLSAAAGEGAPEARRVMNIVNFVRGCEPRYEYDLVKPLVEEVALNTKYHFPNTILLQYDAMLRDDLMRAAKAAEPELTEYGVWFETCRALVEKVGLTWRGREGWDWDWYINPGFLMAYTHAEREKLIDEVFRLFREKFGANPKSVGSWLLDAYSMDYMVRKYGVKGFCICREQDNTDAYGLRGGYFNGAYYPSKKNMLSAATDMANAVKAPVFKMLTPDPIYNYAQSIVPDCAQGCPTMEPVWLGGYRRDIVDWYFRVYTGKGLLNLSYMQTGQENSFGWDAIGKGLPYQAEVIAKYRAEGKLTVERMCDTAERFAKDHPCNCPQTQVALEDWNGKAKSVWYNSRFYRANLLLEGGKLRFRDIHKMCDDFEEPFLDKPCAGWQALYFTPPVADEYLFRTTGRFEPLAFKGTCTGLEVETLSGDRLKVTATFRPESGLFSTVARIEFDETGIVVARAEFSRVFKSADYEFNGYRYRVDVRPMCDAVRIDLSR